MSPRRARLPGLFFCPVEGCGDRFQTVTARDMHGAAPHVRCPHDGWVGLSIARHVAVRRRNGFNHPDVEPAAP